MWMWDRFGSGCLDRSRSGRLSRELTEFVRAIAPDLSAGCSLTPLIPPPPVKCAPSPRKKRLVFGPSANKRFDKRARTAEHIVCVPFCPLRNVKCRRFASVLTLGSYLEKLHYTSPHGISASSTQR